MFPRTPRPMAAAHDHPAEEHGTLWLREAFQVKGRDGYHNARAFRWVPVPTLNRNEFHREMAERVWVANQHKDSYSQASREKVERALQLPGRCVIEVDHVIEW